MCPKLHFDSVGTWYASGMSGEAGTKGGFAMSGITEIQSAPR